MSKIDILNKHLEKKIEKVNHMLLKKANNSQEGVSPSAPDMLKLGSLHHNIHPSGLPKINSFFNKHPSLSVFNTLSNTTSSSNGSNFSSKANSTLGTSGPNQQNGPQSYLEALKNIATTWKDSYK